MKIKKFTIHEPGWSDLDYEIFFIIDDDNYGDVYCSSELSADKKYIIGMDMEDWYDWADAATEEEFYTHLPTYLADYMAINGYFTEVIEFESAAEGHAEVMYERSNDVLFLSNVYSGVTKFRRWSQDDESPEMEAFSHFISIMLEHEL